MLDACGVESPEDLFAHLPEAVRLKRPLQLPPGISEYEIVDYFRRRGDENANGYASFLGAGVYAHYRPVLVDTVVSRGEFLTRRGADRSFRARRSRRCRWRCSRCGRPRLPESRVRGRTGA